MNARYYVSGIGRFASADTMVPDPINPQQFNRYSYTSNNPLKYIDPSGHFQCTGGTEEENRQCYDNVAGWLLTLQEEGGELSNGIYNWFKELDEAHNGNFEIRMMTSEELGGAEMVAVMECSGSDCNTFMGIDRIYGIDTTNLTNNEGAFLFGHEATHLYQYTTRSLNLISSYGLLLETEAYYVESLLREEFSGMLYSCNLDLINDDPNLASIQFEVLWSGNTFREDELVNLQNLLIERNYPVSSVPLNQYPGDRATIQATVNYFLWNQ